MSDTPEVDVGDSTQVQGRAKDLRLAEREEGAALTQLLSGKSGRRWMYQLLESCHIFSTSFRNSVSEMAFAEGERNVGLRMLAALQLHCPARYMEMIQEANDERQQSRREPSRPERSIADSPFGQPGDGWDSAGRS